MNRGSAEFRKRLRWTLPRPSSPGGVYVAAAAVSVVGVVSVLGAQSRPIYLSGWLILTGCALAIAYARLTALR